MEELNFGYTVDPHLEAEGEGLRGYRKLCFSSERVRKKREAVHRKRSRVEIDIVVEGLEQLTKWGNQSESISTLKDVISWAVWLRIEQSHHPGSVILKKGAMMALYLVVKKGGDPNAV